VYWFSLRSCCSSSGGLTRSDFPEDCCSIFSILLPSYRNDAVASILLFISLYLTVTLEFEELQHCCTISLQSMCHFAVSLPVVETTDIRGYCFFESGGLAFISIGTGWASFVSDHKLTIGAFLTFEVLDTACLAVAIHRRSSSPVSPPEVVDADIKPTRLVHRDLPEVGHARRRLSTQLPTTRVTHLHDSTAADIPSFRKTLRKSHVLDVPSSRVDVPTAFWRKYGSCHFDDVWYWLSGPRAACTVDSATYFSGKQRQCFFTDGWASFCRANHLKLGDTLLFEKVGDIEYRVTKV
ncbi:hypothetical protein M758_2G228600, partial [Ceratodon purpureus]